jgi:hypothetical protein
MAQSARALQSVPTPAQQRCPQLARLSSHSHPAAAGLGAGAAGEWSQMCTRRPIVLRSRSPGWDSNPRPHGAKPCVLAASRAAGGRLPLAPAERLHCIAHPRRCAAAQPGPWAAHEPAAPLSSTHAWQHAPLLDALRCEGPHVPPILRPLSAAHARRPRRERRARLPAGQRLAAAHCDSLTSSSRPSSAVLPGGGAQRRARLRDRHAAGLPRASAGQCLATRTPARQAAHRADGWDSASGATGPLPA